jgi:uncharacterized protein YbjQ (UPF0145 family)
MQARDLRDDALVGATVTYQSIDGNMLMVCPTGVAVEIV